MTAGNLDRRLRRLEEGRSRKREPLTIYGLSTIASGTADPDDYFIPRDELDKWIELLGPECAAWCPGTVRY